MDDRSIGEERTVADSGGSSGTSFPPGHMLGQYRLIRLLGRGGMGEVYEVEHRVLGKRYALKLLPPDFAARAGALARFEREARVMANLEHPHIVRVDEFGETDGRYWLRMELMSGVGERVISLANLAKRGGGKIEQKQLLGILKQVVDGLGYAHSRGAVHRDLKPGNILLEKDSKGNIRAKVADFGLVRLVGEEWVRSQAQISIQRSLSLGEEATEAAGEGTSTKALLGTYEYMSPEQKRGEEAGERSDIYALGMIVYRLVTGRTLSLKMPSQIDRGLAPAWDGLVAGALEDDSDERISDCRAFGLLLAEAEEEIERTERDAREKKRREEEAAIWREREEQESKACREREAREAAVRREREDRERREAEDRRAAPHVALSHGRPPAASEKSLTLDLGGDEKLELAWIEPGNFVMGSTASEVGRAKDEGPQHRVEISRGFWMGKYQVTQEQYRRLIDSNPSFFCGDRLPVDGVNWDESKEFCDKLNRSRPAGTPEGFVFRLPTEAEWEYVCRSGTDTECYWGSQSHGDYCWHYGNSRRGGIFSGRSTHPVGQKKPNAWGLYDMIGNVWEWCQSLYREYPYREDDGREDVKSDGPRVLRGGSWYDDPRYLRSARRGVSVPGYAYGNFGFRVVLAGR